mgnify:CR=1 FL=1
MARSKREAIVASEPSVTVTYYYIRPGHFIPGIPTLDLTEEQWNSYPADLREAALANDLYQRVEEPVAVTPVDETPLDETEVSDDQPEHPAE